MHRQNVIVIIDKQTNTPDVYGSLTKVCKAFNLPYYSLRRKSFPIDYKGYVIHKIKFK